MTTLTPRQMIAESLRNGRRWTRSFQGWKAVIDGMAKDGEIHRVAPAGGKARNMVELTGRGWAVYFGENLLITRIDRFAQLLAEGFEPQHIGSELSLTPEETSAALRDVMRQVGEAA